MRRLLLLLIPIALAGTAFLLLRGESDRGPAPGRVPPGAAEGRSEEAASREVPPPVAAPAVSVAGRIRDEDGNPVAEAAVRVRFRSALAVARNAVGLWSEEDDEEETLAAGAGPDGRFRIGGMPPGPVTVVAFAPGFGAAEVEARAPVHDLEIRLPFGGAVRGRVMAEGAERVWLSLLPGRRDVPGTPGAVEFANVAEGRYVLVAAAEGYAPDRSAPFEVRRGATVEVPELRLRPGPLVTGVVTDPDGRPVAGAVVEPRRTENDGLCTTIHGMNETLTAADGRFAVRFRPGRGSFRVSKRGFRPREGDPGGKSFVVGEEDLRFEIVLEPVPGFRGRVVDEAGAPVAGAVVRAVGPRAPDEDVEDEPFEEPGEAPRVDRTGSGGTFVVHGLVEGEEYRIEARAGGRAGLVGPLRFDVPGRAARHEIRLGPAPAPAFVIAGRVVDGADRPLPGAVVRRGEVFAVTDAAGGFSLEDPPPDGPLVFAAAGFPPGVRAMASPGDAARIDVGALRLDGEAATSVSGFVATDAGDPLAGAVVDAEFRPADGPGGYPDTTRTGPDGRYRLVGPLVPAAEVHLAVRAPGRRGETRSVRAEPAAVADFRLGIDDAVTGRITFLGPAPEQLHLDAVSEDGGSAGGWPRLDPVSGTWSERWPPGRYDVWLAAPGYAPLPLGEVEVRAGVANRAPDAVMTPGGTVEGRVFLADGTPAAGTRLTIRFARAWLEATADGTGRFRFERAPVGRFTVRAFPRGGLPIPADVVVVEGRVTTVELRAKK